MEVCQYEAQIETAIKEPVAEALVLTDDGMHLTAFWARLLCGCGTDGRFDPIFVMENIIFSAVLSAIPAFSAKARKSFFLR